MGDFNQFIWIRENKEVIKSPVLEIGSRHYNKETSINYRNLCQGFEYTGLDILAGSNVDLVLDMTSPFDNIDRILEGRRFKTIICCSVMEHVRDIFTFARNVDRLLDMEGVLFISVPFAWEFHGYPSDFWRFTPEAVKYLFPKLNFISGGTISSHLINDIQKLPANINDYAYVTYSDIPCIFSSDFSLISNIKRGVKFLIRKEFRRKVLVYKWFKTNRLIKTCTINMMGIKK